MRLRAVPRVFDNAIANMRLGMKDGLMQPKVLLEKTVGQTEAIAAQKPGETPFVSVPAGKFPKAFSAADRERLRAAMVAAVREAVLPAYARLAAFLRDEYVPKGRTEPGIWSLPDGAERYAALVASATTTRLTPDEIHELGLREVARIEKEMLAIAKKLGFESLAAFTASVRDDAKLKARSRQQLLDEYTRFIDGMRPELPKLFGRLPRADVKVIAVESFREKEAADASYTKGTPDGARPGYVQVNTFEPEKRSLVEVEATAYHEGVPGHHLQLAIQQELPTIPPFRQQGGYGAFIEGWALYAERLGKEVGFYRDPYSDYGRLESEMLRAIRLVVDTGFHARKWTREQVVQFFRDHSAMDEISIQNETDRYMVWPAQALTYKVGQLRHPGAPRARGEALGARFDIRRFHDEVLGAGPLPLEVLDRRIDAWLATARSS